MAAPPPTLIQVGDAEVLLDDSTRFAAKVRGAGGKVTLEVWPEMRHVWHAFAGLLPEDCFAKHETVSFGRSKRHLSSVPRFIGRRLANLGSGCHCSCVVGVDRIDREVRDVAMVAQVRSR
jgi:acetyl esterase/lipase